MKTTTAQSSRRSAAEPASPELFEPIRIGNCETGIKLTY
jgi:hypothetical protein